MIVKNEEANLDKCLKSIAGFMDEIIIVDTGSSDRTKEIALHFTDKVYDYQWNNNFSDARNFSISKAGNEFILVIDSDEITDCIDIKEIKKLIGENPEKIGRLLRVNEYTRNSTPYQYSERVNRLFSKRHYRYEGIIHEQVTPIGKEDTDTFLIPLTVRHSGYEGDLETRKRKTERNIRLLEQACINNPNDPYLLYQLGKSYYMQEDYVAACGWFEKALGYDVNPRLEYVQDMVESYGYALINAKRYSDALQLLNIYDEFAVNADFIYLIGLIYMNNAMFDASISEFIKATKVKEFKMDGVNSYRAFYNIGVIYECLGKRKEAQEYYLKCGDYELAKSRLS
jgi:glycosyltransferase involved in cell wall biosynthesis